MKLPMLQAKTISLLDAPELREYLLASPELLRPGDYMELIAGAPTSLKEKREYLTAFLKCGEASYQADAAEYLAVLNRALAALERAEVGHCALKLWLVGYGHYLSGYPSYSQFLSPLFRAKVYHGELPRFSKFLEPLAEKLREDPGIAQRLYELEYDFTFQNIYIFG